MRWPGLASLTLCGVMLCVLPEPGRAAFEYSHCSSASGALAGAVDLFATAPLDLQYQPALAMSAGMQLEATATRLYNLSDFTLSCGAGRLQLGAFAVGLGTTQLTGSDFYRERSYFANVAWRPRRWMTLGLTASHQQLEFSGGYANLNLTSLAAGAAVEPSQALRLALALDNFNRAKFFADGVATPITAQFSLAYRLSTDISWFATYAATERLPDRLSLGQTWNLHRRVTLRLGVRNQPLDICGGISVRLGAFNFDYSYANSVYLGDTHQLGLRYER